MTRLSEHFVCLSLIVNGRAWHDSPTLSAMDVFAANLEGENECQTWTVAPTKMAQIFGSLPVTNGRPIPV